MTSEVDLRRKDYDNCDKFRFFRCAWCKRIYRLSDINRQHIYCPLCKERLMNANIKIAGKSGTQIVVVFPNEGG